MTDKVESCQDVWAAAGHHVEARPGRAAGLTGARALGACLPSVYRPSTRTHCVLPSSRRKGKSVANTHTPRRFACGGARVKKRRRKGAHGGGARRRRARPPRAAYIYKCNHRKRTFSQHSLLGQLLPSPRQALTRHGNTNNERAPPKPTDPPRTVCVTEPYCDWETSWRLSRRRC